jgi:hypothetical protein
MDRALSPVETNMRTTTDTLALAAVSSLLLQACSGSHSSHNGKPVAGSSATTPAPGASAAQIALDECGLKTQWAGDQYCINPPPADKGFQLHIGPSDYDNPEPKYVMQPGDETVENFPVVSGNTSDVYFYFRQYRMRPGSHHLIVSASGGPSGSSTAPGGSPSGSPSTPGVFGGRGLGGSQNLALDDPRGGVVAPENQGVGMPLSANTPITMNLHYMNYFNHSIIKEVWVNYWYKDASEVTQPASVVFSPTPMHVTPGQHMLVHAACPVSGSGRVIDLAGHRHANNLRFSIWRERGSQSDLVYEDYDWEHPLALEYSSVTANTPANRTNSIGGGWSGILDLQDGDNLAFECDIVNNTDQTFVGRNEATNDEMCIMTGESIDSKVPFQCTSTTTLLQ